MIPIKNIYYMLSYAFKVLNEKGYKDIETIRMGKYAHFALCKYVCKRACPRLFLLICPST